MSLREKKTMYWFVEADCVSDGHHEVKSRTTSTRKRFKILLLGNCDVCCSCQAVWYHTSRPRGDCGHKGEATTGIVTKCARHDRVLVSQSEQVRQSWSSLSNLIVFDSGLYHCCWETARRQDLTNQQWVPTFTMFYFVHFHLTGQKQRKNLRKSKVFQSCNAKRAVTTFDNVTGSAWKSKRQEKKRWENNAAA